MQNQVLTKKGTVSSLHIYPLKSAHGINQDALNILLRGPQGDREWLIRSPGGKFISQRLYPRMALIVPQIAQSGKLILSGENMKSLEVPSQTGGGLLRVKLWKADVQLIDQGDDAAAWVTKFLQLPPGYRLVRRTDRHPRLLSQSWIDNPDADVSLADGYPLLVTSLSSLAVLNTWLPETIPMDRFRANIVVEDFPAWAEDRWSVVQIDSLVFDVVKPCARCVIPSVDQQTAERTQISEPLRTLVRRRGPEQLAKSAGTKQFSSLTGGFFGWNLVPRQKGRIQAGARVEVLKLRT